MLGLLTLPHSHIHSAPYYALFSAINTGIRRRTRCNLRYHTLKMTLSWNIYTIKLNKEHYKRENAMQWKIARLTSVNDGQGRGRTIARSELIRCEEVLMLSREWPYAAGVGMTLSRTIDRIGKMKITLPKRSLADRFCCLFVLIDYEKWTQTDNDDVYC